MNNDLYQSGECFLAYVNFNEKKGGKVRPVVLIHDKEENQFFACSVTSQINKPKNQKYGYIVKDWKEAGLDRPSIIKCNKEDMYKVKKPFQLIKKIGNLTIRDLEGFLIKQIKVRFMENQRISRRKQNEYER